MVSIKNCRVGVQFLILFGVCGLLLILTAGIGYLGIQKVGRQATQAMENEGMFAEIAAAVTVDSLGLRRYEKDSFLNIAKPEKVASYQKKWHKTFQKLEKHLDQLAALSRTPETRQAVEKMKRGALNYRTGINLVWQKMSAGEIRDPAAGNHAIKSYKGPIRDLIETAFSLSMSANERLEQTPAVLNNFAAKTQWGMTLTGVLALVVFAALGFFMTRNITSPLKRLVEMIREMENGHLEKRLHLDRQDEFGQVATAMDALADCLEHEMVGNLEKLASGNLTFEVVPRDERDRVRGALKKLALDLNEIMERIQTAGEQIAAGSMQVSNSSQSLSESATES
ncbi:MAG: HAMP domain-containing protein, partial [Deltaproteobacteria bacterium]